MKVAFVDRRVWVECKVLAGQSALMAAQMYSFSPLQTCQVATKESTWR
jgi:hypothetical protein